MGVAQKKKPGTEKVLVGTRLLWCRMVSGYLHGVLCHTGSERLGWLLLAMSPCASRVNPQACTAPRWWSPRTAFDLFVMEGKGGYIYRVALLPCDDGLESFILTQRRPRSTRTSVCAVELIDSLFSPCYSGPC